MTWPHIIGGVPAHGIVSLDPPTIRCDGCPAEFTRAGSLHVAVILSGMRFNPRRPDDRRRLCSPCSDREWPERVVTEGRLSR